MHAICEAEIAAWRGRSGLRKPDSFRVPLTQTRQRVRQLPLTAENRWFNPRTGEWEHLALKYLNFSQEEWVHMNLPSQEEVQRKVAHPLCLRDPEAIVACGERLLRAGSWPEVVLGVVINTGRSVAEIVKTGQFRVKTKYSVWYEGEPNRSNFRESHFEIPTFSPASLVVEAVERVRRIVECEGLTKREVSQRYGRAVREAAYRHVLRWVPLFPGEHDVYTVLYCSVYGSLAVYWYCPATVSTSIYLATIEGHRYIREARSEERRDQLARAAHYFDYVIADGAGNIDQRRGIRLGEPDVEVLLVFKERIRSEESKAGVEGGDHSDTLSLAEEENQHVSHDAFGVSEQQGRVLLQGGRPTLSFEQLHLPAETQAVLQEGMELTGASDLLSYLLAAGEREARQLCSQARREDRERYRAMPTSKLVGMKVSGAGKERYRRAVHPLMQWNETHGSLEQWSITTLTIQKLVGGRKDAIKAYLKAHREEIEEHHRRLSINPSYNRKAEPIGRMMTIPEEPTAFPWGKAAALQEDRASMVGDGVHAT